MWKLKKGVAKLFHFCMDLELKQWTYFVRFLGPHSPVNIAVTFFIIVNSAFAFAYVIDTKSNLFLCNINSKYTFWMKVPMKNG